MLYYLSKSEGSAGKRGPFTLWHNYHSHRFSSRLFFFSPLFSSLYTNSCTSSYTGIHLVKFADDTALISFLQGDEKERGPVLDLFSRWSHEAELLLNTSKTEEMSSDFRKELTSCLTTTIRELPIQFSLYVIEYTYHRCWIRSQVVVRSIYWIFFRK